MSYLADIISQKPYLVWYVKDVSKLSEESLFEHILNYGNWEDYHKAEKALGLKKAADLFEKLRNKKRTNLRPQTINYFQNYYQQYA